VNNLAKAKPITTARPAAAKVISDVIRHHRSLNGVLRTTLLSLPDNERSLCQQLCYGVIRWQPQLQAITEQLLSKSLKSKDSDIQALLLCGLYQLRAMRLPEHAALSETVNGCAALGKPWAKGLINASLRNYQRNQSNIDSKALADDAAKFAHPDWLIQTIKQDWPEQWQQVLEANNQQPPMFLRVNQQQQSREQYLGLLIENDIPASEVKQSPEAILLDSPCDVYQLPGFETGTASVQDAAAQQVAAVLQIGPKQRILDACAAPGGKTCHILETEPSNEIIALDIDPERLTQIKQNTDRLGLHATLKAADAGDTESWWDGKKFDRILIDAPCSGTGVIRRHPDIKLLRRPSDIDSLVEKQQQLLENLWPLLNTGGLLVYTTCSLIQRENEQQIMDFLAKHPEAEEQQLNPPPATRRTAGYQRLPGDDNLDGFYYACLRYR
jgi:16S rRNA (cytosine967-C5)-methyltransferase